MFYQSSKKWEDIVRSFYEYPILTSNRRFCLWLVTRIGKTNETLPENGDCNVEGWVNLCPRTFSQCSQLLICVIIVSCSQLLYHYSVRKHDETHYTNKRDNGRINNCCTMPCWHLEKSEAAGIRVFVLYQYLLRGILFHWICWHWRDTLHFRGG